MTFDEYVEWTRTTAVYPQLPGNAYVVLGLLGEAGEVAELTKKTLRDNTEMDRQALALEIGDVLWYIARLCDDYDFSLDSIAHMNMGKLNSRKERGVLGGSGDYR